MPKVRVTGKGLFQEAGTGLDVGVNTVFGGTIAGHRTNVVVLGGTYFASASDSGSTFVLPSGISAAAKVRLPLSASNGWHATFVVTGNLGFDWTIERADADGSSFITGAFAASNTTGLGGYSSALTSDGTAITFVSTAVTGGDHCTITCVAEDFNNVGNSTSRFFFAKGTTST